MLVTEFRSFDYMAASKPQQPTSLNNDESNKTDDKANLPSDFSDKMINDAHKRHWESRAHVRALLDKHLRAGH